MEFWLSRVAVSSTHSIFDLHIYSTILTYLAYLLIVFRSADRIKFDASLVTLKSIIKSDSLCCSLFNLKYQQIFPLGFSIDGMGRSQIFQYDIFLRCIMIFLRTQSKIFDGTFLQK